MESDASSLTLSFSQLVFSDVRRHRRGVKDSWLQVIVRVPVVPGVLASILLRAQQCLVRSGRLLLGRMVQVLANTLVGADFCPGAAVGSGLVLMHPVGVTIGSGSRIGDDVTFAAGVTLAARYYEDDGTRDNSYPTIGDGAVIGAHAVIVGGVRVGRNSVVGANSVVLEDVPDDTVVFGVPATFRRHRTPHGTAT